MAPIALIFPGAGPIPVVVAMGTLAFSCTAVAVVWICISGDKKKPAAGKEGASAKDPAVPGKAPSNEPEKKNAGSTIAPKAAVMKKEQSEMKRPVDTPGYVKFGKAPAEQPAPVGYGLQPDDTMFGVSPIGKAVNYERHQGRQENGSQRSNIEFVPFSVGAPLSVGGLSGQEQVPFAWNSATDVSNDMKISTERIVREVVASGVDIMMNLPQGLGTQFWWTLDGGERGTMQRPMHPRHCHGVLNRRPDHLHRKNWWLRVIHETTVV